ncbi:MAG: DUF2927 domain-containing protein [Alkalilacustris sp.]
MRRAALVVLLAGLAAGCAPAPPPATRLAPPEAEGPPPLPRFGAARPTPPLRSNPEIAHDILELGFYMESGRALPVLSRFEGPVTVFLTGPEPPGARAETEVLVARLRQEAGLEVTLAPRGSPPQGRRITAEFVPRAQMRRAVPQAACFLVPNVSDWAGFRSQRRSPRLSWTKLVEREEVAVFLPSDTTPQETRDCLHEEIGQAFGPLNDLFRLQDSVFNDDNFQTILTGFDMLVLRTWNDPALASGMDRAAVAERLPGILARLNPAGQRPGPATMPPRRPQTWQDAIEAAMGAGGTRARRRAAAEEALAIALQEGWQDARLAFSWFTLGRLARPQEGELALAAFLQAGLIYRALPGAEAHLAHVDMQLAVFALSLGDPAAARRLARAAQPAARATHNAALLSSLMMVEAEALERLSRDEDARRLRLDSLAWARYGFGSMEAAQARLAEVAAVGRPRRPAQATGG